MIRTVRRAALAACLIGVIGAAAPASAHEEMSLDGKVTAVTAQSVEITTKEGYVFTVALNAGTKVVAGEKRLTLKDLKVGQTVLVDGYGDILDDMLALAIHIEQAQGDRAG